MKKEVMNEQEQAIKEVTRWLERLNIPKVQK
jgi:hypothetical protein